MSAAELPVLDALPGLRDALARSNTAILQAPPGAGKSTVLPLRLLDEPWLEGRKILMLEPRRLAARAVAWRLADQLNEDPGATVGFRVRFESVVGKTTRIEVVTEGILTRMLQEDNGLEGVGLVIFDEFHERSLHADLALALCRESQSVLRPDLRILIMSATLDGERLSALLGNAPVITSLGRQYPIDYRYLEPDTTQPIAQQVVRCILKALREEQGDILAFLPGSGDIHRAAALLEEHGPGGIRVYSLYGDLPHEEQQRALQPDPNGLRKVVLSTSIAETSLTIEGIRVVVDSGYARVPRFDPRSGFTKLETVSATSDTTDQRAGRAGRLGPGVCYRLWAEHAQGHRVPHRKPEILDADLAQLVLELAAWGHHDLSALTWLTPPPPGSVAQARNLLESLDALESGKITDAGKRLLKFPTHPRLAHLLLYGQEHGLATLAADAAAVIEERDPLGKEAGADLSLRVETLRRWRKKERVAADRAALDRIDRVARQWCRLLHMQTETGAFEHHDLGRLVAAAYPERIGRRDDERGRYRLANGRAARLPEHDPLTHDAWIAVAQLDAGTNEGKIFLAAPYDPSDALADARPQAVIEWDERNGQLIAREEWRLGNLVAATKPLTNPNPEQVAAAVLTTLRTNGLRLFEPNETVLQFIARAGALANWRPELDLPDYSEAGLLTSLEEWAAPYLGEIRKREDLRKVPVYDLLKNRLSWEHQSILDRLVPERIEVPSGSQIRIEYFADGAPPVLAVRLQEVFGWTDTPTVNEGRTQLLMHLLSPGYKPVQVTRDLRSFWQGTYHEVRKELRMRYPKHSWPEDPWTAQAVRGVKKRN